jgi:hypothetical protein
VTEVPQPMSSDFPTHNTSSSRPFVTYNGTQSVQGTGTTPRPQDEYELSWTGMDPPNFIRIVRTDAHLSRPDTLTIPPAAHDDDKSTTPIVRTSGGAAGGDRTTQPDAMGTDTLAPRHPDPRPVSPARSNVSRRGHDEDWGSPPPPGAYYANADIASSYSLELEYLDDPTEPLTESQRHEAGLVDVPAHDDPDQPAAAAAATATATTDLPELAIAHYDPVTRHYAVNNNDVCIDTPAQPPHGRHVDQQPGSCCDHGHIGTGVAGQAVSRRAAGRQGASGSVT